MMTAFAPAPAAAQQTERVPRPQDLIRLLPRRTPNPKPPIPEIRARTEGFFRTLQEGKVRESYELLLANERLGQQQESVSLLVRKTEQALALYGKLLGFEVYDSYHVGSSVTVVTYITHLPLQPLRWRFVFYKPEERWNLIDLRVDDVLDDLIEQ